MFFKYTPLSLQSPPAAKRDHRNDAQPSYGYTHYHEVEQACETVAIGQARSETGCAHLTAVQTLPGVIISIFYVHAISTGAAL